MPIIVILCIFLVPIFIGQALLSNIISIPFKWLIGLFMIGIFWLSCYVIAIPKPLVTYVFLGITIFCASRWRVNKPKIQLSPSLIVYLCLGLIFIFSVTDIYANPISQWDGFAIWLQKAKDFYYWVPLPALTFVHYPGLGSMLWSVVMTVFGFHESYGRFIYPVIYCMFLASVWSVINVRKSAAVYAISVLGIAIIFLRPSIYSGYQDDFLAITVAVSALLYSLYMSNPLKRHYYLLACFFAGSLGLIKNEGVLMGLIIFSTFWLMNANKMKWNGLLLFLGPLSFWSVAILLYGIDPRMVQGDQVNVWTILEGYKHVSRIPIIIPYISQYIVATPWYSMISIASFLAMFYVPSVRKVIIYIWVIIGIHIISVFWIYMSTTAPLVWHLDTSFERLMDQHMMLYAILVICSIPLVLSGKQRHNPWV